MSDLLIYGVKGYEREILETTAKSCGITVELREQACVEAMPHPGEAKAICIFVEETLTQPILKKLKETGVSLILLRSKGFDNVDLKASAALGITVQNTDYPQTPIVEHTLALVFALNRRLKTSAFQMLHGDFSLDHLMSEELEGRVAGVIGTGLIGERVAEALQNLGMRVVAFDPHPNPRCTQLGIPTLNSVEALLDQAEVVTLHCPAMPSAGGYYLNAERIARMPQGALLINTARGTLLDTQAALQAIQSEHLGGLAIDVYEHESGFFYHPDAKTSQDPLLQELLQHPRVWVTPHHAFLSRKTLKVLFQNLFKNYQSWQAKQGF